MNRFTFSLRNVLVVELLVLSGDPSARLYCKGFSTMIGACALASTEEHDRNLRSYTTAINQMYVDLNDRFNPTWDELKATLKTGTNTNGPAYGSTIDVNQNFISSDPANHTYSDRAIPSSMMIHTPTSSYIGRKYFPLQTRWYQEDNHTQIFRMFPGDDNVASSRTKSPRVEAFNQVGWKRGAGWYEFSGRYTFVSLRGGAAVFQIKHNLDTWSLQLVVNRNETDGTWFLSYKNYATSSIRKVVQTNILNKSFDIRVIDDGTNHKVFVNNQLRAEGVMANRTNSEINKARWGFYSPGTAMDRDILLFVTGASVKPIGNISQQVWRT